jgi:hypothetical protein
LAVDARAFGEEQPLGEREHLDGEADVDRELEREALTVGADVIRRPEFVQDGLDAAVGVLVAADHDRERARLHLRDASRDRRVEHERLLRAHSLGEVAARLQADSAHVDPGFSGAEPGEDAVGSCRDVLEHAVVGHRGEDDVGRLGHLAWRVAPLQPVVDQTLGIVARPRFTEDWVARGKKPRRHAAAHVTEADEADRGPCRSHVAYLRRLGYRV